MFKTFLIIALVSLCATQNPTDSLRFLSTTTEETVFDLSKSDPFLSQFHDPKFLSSLDDQDNPTDFSCEMRKTSKLDPAKAAPFYFVPALKAKVLPDDKVVEWSNGCFGKNTAQITKFTKEEMVVTLSHSDKKFYFCKDTYLVSTFDYNFLHFSFSTYQKTIVLKNLTDDQFATIKFNGIKFHTFCQNVKQSLWSIFETAKLFLGGMSADPNAWTTFFSSHVPQYMETANINFVTELAGFNLKLRTTDKKVLEIDPKNIRSGDFVAIRRWDGVDPLIMWGTGTHIGHTAVAMWEDGELYVYESQDGWYWPRHGIQKNKWAYWIEHAQNADFEVSILPLSDEMSQKFDVEKALNKYQELAGLDYGYRNFLFGWLDTADHNLPVFVDFDIVATILTLLERIIPSVVKLIIGEALNARMNTMNKTIPEIAAIAAGKGMKLGEVVAMPELEEYRYSNGQNLVCSSFCTAMWKAGGLFDDMEILPSEFGPNDVYQLKIFNPAPKLPGICTATDPSLPYCQLTGKYLMELPNYNSVTPYSKMNERCPSIGPAYLRQDGC